MITFEGATTCFNYRVGGVCIEEQHVLLQDSDDHDLWTLPGGRCELGESSMEALRREMREELGTDVEFGKLLWIVENFFAFEGRDFHELALYYECSLLDSPPHLARDGDYRTMDGALPIVFRWFPLSALSSVPLVPSFLRLALRDLPTSTRRVVHHGV